MKIASIHIQNFRGIHDITFKPEKNINVIVGPNAMGKTTVLEAIRLAKGLLAPRYFQEAQQTLISLGALSQHFQVFGNQALDYSALARDASKSLEIAIDIEINPREVQKLSSLSQQMANDLLRTQFGGMSEQGQFGLTQYLSSKDGQAKLSESKTKVDERLKTFMGQPKLTLHLAFNPTTGSHAGKDVFSQIGLAVLEGQLPAQFGLFSYFPADRAFPGGEVNVQIGPGDAAAQVQAHMGQPATKYQRLKHTIVQGVVTNQLNYEQLTQDFKAIFDALLPGKSLHSLSVNPIGQLKVNIADAQTSKVFDIDSMSSGEKGLILTFLMIQRSMTEGGILLIDEPELHLNPGVTRHILNFLADKYVQPLDLQAFICTHSPEILGTAFERDDCNLYHLRSSTDITRVYRKDQGEMFEALNRLGASTADVLFSRGTIFVEGEHDAEILTEGFFDIVSGCKISPLGGREEIEKEIRNLQNAETKGDLKKPQLFIFDLDRKPSDAKSTPLVKVAQLDRYCLENYLIEENVLFDLISELAKRKPESRGTFSNDLKELALSQLGDVAIKATYAHFEPDNPGLRPSEVTGKSAEDAADILFSRLQRISERLEDIDRNNWTKGFLRNYATQHQTLRDQWEREWKKACNGKRLIKDLYRRYEIQLDALSLKKRIVRQMAQDKSEGWRVIESQLRDGITSPQRAPS